MEDSHESCLVILWVGVSLYCGQKGMVFMNVQKSVFLSIRVLYFELRIKQIKKKKKQNRKRRKETRKSEKCIMWDYI